MFNNTKFFFFYTDCNYIFTTLLNNPTTKLGSHKLIHPLREIHYVYKHLKGSCTNHVDGFLDFFAPPLPPHRQTWTFQRPPLINHVDIFITLPFSKFFSSFLLKSGKVFWHSFQTLFFLKIEVVFVPPLPLSYFFFHFFN